jgi:regulator of sigma E protease
MPVNILISAAAFLVAIGILVAVHEYGHFLAARRVGVRVLRFSIGFGRPLWLWRGRTDATEYCISAVPFGGYVKLLDEREAPVDPAEQHRAFNRQPIPARIVILAAGSAMNFLFAIFAYWCMFMIGVPGARALIGEVAPGSVAERAGLSAQAEIIAVGTRGIATWEGAVVAMLDELLDDGRIELQIRDAGGGERRVTLDVRGRAAELTEPGGLFPGLGLEPWSPELPPVLGEILGGGSAERAGLRSGDRIVSAAGVPVVSWPAWVEIIRARPGQVLDVVIARNGEELAVQLPVDRVAGESGEIGRIGASPAVPDDLFDDLRANERYGPVSALGQALHKTWEMSSLTVRMIGRMLVGDVSVRNISGPINIAQYAGYSASIGLAPFLSFLAVVSLSLGVLNLMPVPMLDGGQILFQAVEAVRGAPLSERVQIIGQQLGIALLLMLMSFAFYNDISRLLG